MFCVRAAREIREPDEFVDVRATDDDFTPDDATVPVRVAVRVAPPVARAAAARVALVVAVRDETVRDAFVRGDTAVVVRAATARDEFPVDLPRPDATDVAFDGVTREAVERFAILRDTTC